MLRQRIITSVILAPLAIAVILLAPNRGLAAALGVVLLVAGWEWSRLVPIRSAARRVAWLALIAATLVLAGARPEVLAILPAAGCAWWLVAMVWVSRPAAGREARWLRTGAGLAVMVPAWAAVIGLQAQDPWRVLILLGVVWCADTGAYFAGRAWGRRQLAPAVSPGKTWAGAAGGFAAAVFFALLVGFSVWSEGGQILRVALLAAVTVIFSDFGDLFISLMKRHRGLKDSGHLLPGHGGVLDRLDSLFAAAPVFATGSGVLGL